MSDATLDESARLPRPSLRRRLLMALVIPMLVVLILDAVLTYSVALAYANHVHDGDLAGNAVAVAQMLEKHSQDSSISPQARFLLEYDPGGRGYFAIRSTRHGLLDGSKELSALAPSTPAGRPPRLFDISLHGRSLRAAGMSIENPAEHGDTLDITIAENLRARHQEARQILMLAVPLQVLLIMVMLSLVWFSVNTGLRVLDPLTRRLARREHDLAPIDDLDVPAELLPLTRTIDGLFARLRNLMALHERFIADAAHQLRTPLAGLRLHVERAMANAREPEVTDSLSHIKRLTERLTRSSSQLLALTRAQTPAAHTEQMARLDLAALLTEAIEMRLHDAWRADVDLGYEGPDTPTIVVGNAAALRELLDNLIDNALRYASSPGQVTVGLQAAPDGSACLSVEDDGVGVDNALLPRLGERFFRAPGAPDGGTGLGLAIVRHIAERHGARVAYMRGAAGGLRVEIHFPSQEKAV